MKKWKLGLILSAISLLLISAVALLVLSTGPGSRLLQKYQCSSVIAKNANIIGKQRPDFSLPDLRGNSHSISEWDGKVLLINFWASWCPVCKTEIIDFIKIRKLLGTENFEIIGIAIDNPNAVRDFVESQGIPYPILNAEGDASCLSQAYGNRSVGVPHNVLVDSQGIIRSKKTGVFKHDELLRELQALLQKKNNN